MVVLEPIAQSAFKFADLGQSFLVFCHLSKCVLKAEFLRLYGTKQNAVDSLNTFDLVGNTLPTQDGTRNADTLGIANGHNLKNLSHVHTVITRRYFASDDYHSGADGCCTLSPALLDTALTRERGAGFVFGRVGDVA